MNDEAKMAVANSTGFTIKPHGKDDWFLFTNWHCITGRHQESGISLSKYVDPEIMRVYFHSKNKIGTWIAKDLRLFDENGNKKWIEHPLGMKIDIVGIVLENYDDVDLYNISDSVNSIDLPIFPGDATCIIGYPNGLTAGGKFPIWKTGHIASDFDLNWDGKPLFLIDATTRIGMSGSPVVCIKEGLIHFPRNRNISGRFTNFIGIYSGRIDETTEIGRVWKPESLVETLNFYYSH